MPTAPPRRRAALTVAVLAATWLLWSGHYTPLLLALGAVSCFLVFQLARRIGFFEHDLFSLHLGPRLPAFWLWLLKEIARSNVEVARIILDPRLPVSPTVLVLDAKPRNRVGQAILGNSITLTPGTVTIDAHRGQLKVHCLTRAAADALRAGHMNERVAQLMTNR